VSFFSRHANLTVGFPKSFPNVSRRRVKKGRLRRADRVLSQDIGFYDLVIHPLSIHAAMASPTKIA
jgi:hypothetical protein